jgi:hypothetical protein
MISNFSGRRHLNGIEVNNTMTDKIKINKKFYTKIAAHKITNSLFSSECQMYGAELAQSVQRRTTGWTAGVRFLNGETNSSLSVTSRSALRPTRPPIRCLPVALYPGLKQPGSEADNSPPSTAEVKYDGIYLYSPMLLHDMVLN